MKNVSTTARAADVGPAAIGAYGGELADVVRVLEMEAAASEVQHAALRSAPADRIGKRVEARAAVFLDLEQTSFTQDAEMFRHVVLRHRESPRNLANVERFVEQQSDDADPGVLPESSERDDAVVPVNDGKGTATGWKTVKLNGLINLAGRGHGGRNTSSHKPLLEASPGPNGFSR
jgi:hypothetical protein